jgi:fatty acid desaturase
MPQIMRLVPLAIRSRHRILRRSGGACAWAKANEGVRWRSGTRPGDGCNGRNGPLGGWRPASTEDGSRSPWPGAPCRGSRSCPPTRRRAVNDALGFPPLNLWLPYQVYRASHLRHHRDAWLTDPLEDPETTYVHPAQWQRLSRAGRAQVRACNTLLGRMTLGPARVMVRLYRAHARRLRGEPPLRRVWAAHALGVAVVLAWLVLVCRIPPAEYAALFVYPGLSLAMIRSLAEHRAEPAGRGRSAVVERGGPLGLLFLNNNLHALHHARPAVAWYRLPALWRQQRAAFLAGPGLPLYRGYGEVARRFLVTPHHPGPHPGFPEGSRP